MYGMYTIFQQMHSSWQNQMQEQYSRDQRLSQPQQQYAVVYGNPGQLMMMSMLMSGAMGAGFQSPSFSNGMFGGGGGSSFSPGGCAKAYSGGEPNPIFEVTGLEVRNQGCKQHQHEQDEQQQSCEQDDQPQEEECEEDYQEQEQQDCEPDEKRSKTNKRNKKSKR